MASTTSEKVSGVHYDGEPERRPSELRRGSIYQVIPPGERRMSAQGRRISVVDDIFGEIKEDGPNYRNVSSPKHWHCRGTDSLRSDGLELLC
jgi:hypothetical protein